MGDIDSDRFESADEGISQTQGTEPLPGESPRKTVDSSVSRAGQSKPIENKKSNRVRKKKTKKRPVALPPEKEITPEPSVPDTQANETLPDEENVPDNKASVAAPNENLDVKPSSTEADDANLSESADVAGPTDATALDFNQLSDTARTIFKGFGDGLSALAGTIVQPLYSEANNDSSSEEAARRQKRKEEEEAERKGISEAWSNVWNAAWGSDEGWEVEDDALVDSEPNPQSNQNVVDATGEMENSSLPTEAKKEMEVSSGLWDWSGVSSLAQQLTSSLQTTSMQLVQEGVSVLERIGKKTMSVLEENDPGFQHTKKLLHPTSFVERPSLSEVLREAHERNQKTQETDSAVRGKDSSKFGFLSELEAQRGLVHLEALELVSERVETQLRVKLDNSLYGSLTFNESKMEQIWNLLQLDGSETNSDVVETSNVPAQPPADLPENKTTLWCSFKVALQQLDDVYPGDRLLKVIEAALCSSTAKEVQLDMQGYFRQAIQALAQLTSAVLEYLHKLAECILVRNAGQNVDFVLLTEKLVKLIQCSINLETDLCDEYVQLIKTASKHPNPESAVGESPALSPSQMVATLLLECSNAQNYLKDATRLLVPVFQLAYIESHSTNNNDDDDVS